MPVGGMLCGHTDFFDISVVMRRKPHVSTSDRDDSFHTLKKGLFSLPVSANVPLHVNVQMVTEPK